MTHPFELSEVELADRLDEMVSIIFGDMQSQFLTLPKGDNYVDFARFQDAYETLKSLTGAFERFTEETVWAALDRDAMAFVVLRTILGFTPPEWADLARSDLQSDVTQNVARSMDSKARRERDYFARMRRAGKSIDRAKALVNVAIHYIADGAPAAADELVHRLDKIDTKMGLASVRDASALNVPYAMLLYERFLGRPFASHRDGVSELVGEVMESAIEEQLARSRVSFRKTRRAERIPGFEQAPDFFVPSELAPSVIIEAGEKDEG